MVVQYISSAETAVGCQNVSTVDGRMASPVERCAVECGIRVGECVLRW